MWYLIVLLFVMGAGFSRSPVIEAGHIVFGNEQACKAAAQAVRDSAPKLGSHIRVVTICAPKGKR